MTELKNKQLSFYFRLDFTFDVKELFFSVGFFFTKKAKINSQKA
jgi:hypothetical protein